MNWAEPRGRVSPVKSSRIPLKRVGRMIPEARGRKDLVILVAGAPVGLDVSELDGPAQVLRREPFSLQKVQGKGLEHVSTGAGEDFEEWCHGPNLVAVPKADLARRIRFPSSPVAGSTRSVSQGRMVRWPSGSSTTRSEFSSGSGDDPSRAMARGGRIRSSKMLIGPRLHRWAAVRELSAAAYSFISPAAVASRPPSASA